MDTTSEPEPSVAPTTALPDTADPSLLAQRATEADAWTERGVQLCRKARWRDAIEPLRRATELNPKHPIAHYYLGEAYNHTDQLSSALEAFEAATVADPTNWRAQKGIGIVLDRMRRPQEASAAYQRAREMQQPLDG